MAEEMDTDPKYPIPSLTFGLEQEFNFTVSKAVFAQYTPPLNSPSSPSSSDHTPSSESSTSTSSSIQRSNFTQDRLQYLLALLNRDLPNSKPKHDSKLGEVVFERPKVSDYTSWHLTWDDSLSPSIKEELASLHGVEMESIQAEEFQINELRSAIAKYRATVKKLGGLLYDVKAIDYSLDRNGALEVRFGKLRKEMESAKENLKVWERKMKTRKADIAALEHEIEDRFDRVGAELVSAILEFDNVESWSGMLRQVESDLAWDGEKGAWVGEETHLHAHFAFADQEMDLQTVKNICVIYGLWEGEIERWHPMGIRSDIRDRDRMSQYCTSLRRGMEGWMFDLRYTPQEFASRVYNQRSFLGLKQELYGNGLLVEGLKDGEPGEEIKRVGAREGDMPGWNWKQVNISFPRGRKKATLEFRQHIGTLQEEEIRWWVLFSGRLLRYAHFLAQVGFELRDEAEEGFSFLDEVTKRSLLDIIGFPEEGKSFFRGMERRYWDAAWERKRDLEKKLIAGRVERVKNGEKTGDVMDREIMAEEWYIDVLRKNWELDDEDPKEQKRRWEEEKEKQRKQREKAAVKKAEEILNTLARKQKRNRRDQQAWKDTNVPFSPEDFLPRAGKTTSPASILHQQSQSTQTRESLESITENTIEDSIEIPPPPPQSPSILPRWLKWWLPTRSHPLSPINSINFPRSAATSPSPSIQHNLPPTPGSLLDPEIDLEEGRDREAQIQADVAETERLILQLKDAFFGGRAEELEELAISQFDEDRVMDGMDEDTAHPQDGEERGNGAGLRLRGGLLDRSLHGEEVISPLSSPETDIFDDEDAGNEMTEAVKGSEEGENEVEQEQEQESHALSPGTKGKGENNNEEIDTAMVEISNSSPFSTNTSSSHLKRKRNRVRFDSPSSPSSSEDEYSFALRQAQRADYRDYVKSLPGRGPNLSNKRTKNGRVAKDWGSRTESALQEAMEIAEALALELEGKGYEEQWYSNFIFDWDGDS
jgi:hypothetical protein